MKQNGSNNLFILVLLAGLIALMVFQFNNKPKPPAPLPPKAMPTSQVSEPTPAQSTPPPTLTSPTALPTVSAQDQQKLLNTMNAKAQKDMDQWNAMFRSEASARAAMKAQSDCMVKALGFTFENLGPDAQKAVTPEMRGQMHEIPVQIQAGCLTTAKMLLDKYPSLRHEFETQVLSKAHPQALKIFKNKK